MRCVYETVARVPHARFRKGRRFRAVSVLFLGLLMAICFHGCALPLGRKASVTRDQAFIFYSPTGDDSGKLRLAVKDIIDMKGRVTTAGSKYVAESNPPAKRDAKCLASARQDNVRIVGKTNLNELAFGTSGMNEYYGTPVNPLDRHRIPGGSCKRIGRRGRDARLTGVWVRYGGLYPRSGACCGSWD